MFSQSTPVSPINNLLFKSIFLKGSFHSLFASLGFQQMFDNCQAPYMRYLLHVAQYFTLRTENLILYGAYWNLRKRDN